MKYHAWIRGLRSLARQKNSQVKYEYTTTCSGINNTIDCIIVGVKKWKPEYVSKKTTYEEG